MSKKYRLKHDRFAAELAARKLSQNAWAQRLGVSKAYLSQLVNGRRRFPGPVLRQRMLKELGLSHEALFEVLDETPSASAPENSAPADAEEVRSLGSREPLLDLHCAGLRVRVESAPGTPLGEGIEMIILELKQAVRRVFRSPAFSMAVVLILGLAIGVNTTLFSTVNTVLFQPPPYPDPDRIVRIWGTREAQDGWLRGALSPPDFVDLRRLQSSFSDLGLFSVRNGNLTGGLRPLSIEFAWVTPGLLRALQVEPSRGRLFGDEEEGAGRDRLAIISERLWTNLFGRDPSVLGSSVVLDDQQLRIVGVMPAQFQFPSPSTELWKPYGFDLSNEENRGSTFVSGLGRLKPGISLERAQQEVQRIAGSLENSFPESNANRGFFLEGLHESEVREVRRGLLLLWGAVGLVLLMACVNVANLMLVRAERRRQEFSIRSVLGAGPREVIRQLLTESLVLAGLAMAAGLVLALVGNRLVVWLAEDRLPRVHQLSLNWSVVGFTLILTLITAILFGLAPAFHATRFRLAGDLRVRSGFGTSGWRLQNGMVVVQLTLALTLLCGAGLLVRSFYNLLNVDLGFQPQNLLSFRVEPPMSILEPEDDFRETMRRFEAERGRAARLFKELQVRVDSLPGVAGVSAVNRMPLTGNMWQTAVAVEGRTYERSQDRHPATYRSILPGYFDTLKTPLLRGRTLRWTDGVNQPSVVVINRAMADAYWPDSNPLGSRITFADPPPSEKFWMTVVGVVENIRHSSLAAEPTPVMYTSLDQSYFGYFGNWGMDFVIRAENRLPGLARQIEEILLELNPDLPVVNFRTMDEVMSANVASRRFTLVLLGVFAGLALVLAIAGIYAVIASMASRRRSEYGIRTALGARPRDVLGSVLAKTLRLTLPGVLLGLVCALVLSGNIAPLLFRTSATDPVTLLGISMLILLVGLLAGLLPAWRCSRLDVNEVLNSE